MQDGYVDIGSVRNDESFITVEKPGEDRKLFDHRSLQLNEDDYRRVCRVAKRKGAKFRDLPGVMVNLDNAAQWDPKVERVLLPSGKPLVPDYAMSFINGKSLKPFGRLWWDETVATVVTRLEPHNQIIIHPEQDRVLFIRENARLQGIPDDYRLFGPVKERYIQVGIAVAVPVSRALRYALGLAYLRKANEEPAVVLP
ncbi:LOW QUALITY PROTEIN: DNA (cytosine-5)-methyltransferase 3-like [Asparagus officinalis]|uniref:LOW QUALITY PROTEIN: DNA (cytosine-5)-methyltransferase 3-like n=1 Tax=Asparagus officinalis TaxID=4686 RepID=UPI00098E85F5|nr:LOW QUALITY PROTEIN: DNA (cytosine-5)-methyltransferase 3-like [Asparagus officinalis]